MDRSLALSRFTSQPHRAKYSRLGTGDYINEVFPTEIVERIWEFLPLRDLLIYASTSRANYIYVHHFLKRKAHKLMGMFFDDVPGVFKFLTNTHSVISGSLALAFTIPSGNRTWEPGDIDLYVTQKHCSAAKEWLTACGYVDVVGGKDNDKDKLREEYAELGSYSRVSAIMRIFDFRNGSRSIDLIVTNSRNAIQPLIGFYGTHVMNCFTGDGFFSAYPTLTSAQRSIINPMVACNGRLPQRVLCIKKYESRGFEFRKTGERWKGEEGDCGKSFHCSHMMRTLRDAGTLYFRLRWAAEVDGVGEGSKELPRGVPEVLWYLGGVACPGGQGPFMVPFVATIDVE